MPRTPTLLLALSLTVLPGASAWASHNPCTEVSLVDCGPASCPWDRISPEGCPPARAMVTVPDADSQTLRETIKRHEGEIQELLEFVARCRNRLDAWEMRGHCARDAPRTPHCPIEDQDTVCTPDRTACITTCKEPHP